MDNPLKKMINKFGLPRIIIAGFFILLVIGASAFQMNMPQFFGDILRRWGMFGILALAMVPAVQCGIGLNFGISMGIVGGLLGGIIVIQLNIAQNPSLVAIHPLFAAWVAILVAIAVNEDGFREVLGAAEGMKEDKASWINFFQWLRGRGLDGVKLIVGDKCLGMLEAVGEVFPEAKYQRCTVHFYRNVFSVTPRSKVKLVAKMLKAIHAQESKKAAREKARAVVEELCSMKLKEAAKKVEDSIEETLTYCDFPSEHWTRIRTNNVIERLNREIRRRTRVVGSFPDGNSALMLVCARLRHVAGTQWGNKKYMNMKHLEAALEDTSIAG